ncbi:CGNR zinc finger domain-containing protein [Roseivivax jejudonensis]|uniref:CGNR zinc finger domain-containing protein n=1 Tax=Roseivivax jejudonensis TaxID=1529041 RepID=UPI000A26917C|nr:ABATE domain-containing protein [Roseivivax jejudonensis]
MARWDQSDWTEDHLVGGHPVLDFLNTAGGRTKQRDVERLPEFASFVAWSEITNIVSIDEADMLREVAEDDPAAADAELAAARRFREALHGCMMAEQANTPWPPAERDAVLSDIRQALLAAQLQEDGGRYGWVVSSGSPGLSLPIDRLALATEALLRSEDLARMRNCERCSWLFIDRGRGRARRWCSMAACGSRAKSARYYERRKAGSA